MRSTLIVAVLASFGTTALGQCASSGWVGASTVWDPPGPPPPALIMFAELNGLPGVTGNIVGYDGRGWFTVGNVATGSTGAGVHKFGTYQNDLIAAGGFGSIGGVSVRNIARYDGAAWHPLGSGIELLSTSTIHDLVEFAGDLYVAGQLESAGGAPIHNIARWNGSQWSSLGSGTNGHVNDLIVHGGYLVAAGAFTEAGGVPVEYMARWTGSTWQNFPTGFNRAVYCVTEFGTGLMVGGSFSSAGGQYVSTGLARWDGTAWTPFGQLSSPPTFFSPVSMCEYNGALVFTAYSSILTSFGGYTTHLLTSNNQWQSLAESQMNTSATTFQGVLVGKNVYRIGGFTPGAIAKLDPSGWRPLCTCAANCDGSQTSPVLTANDFSCFLNAFITGDPYANCDGSTTPPTLNILDFLCYINGFAQGCP